MAREIEDFAHYVKLDVKKIDAVHSLDQLVAQNQLNKERAAYVRQKYYSPPSQPMQVFIKLSDWICDFFVDFIHVCIFWKNVSMLRFEDLRATLGRKLMDERRTINETEELAEQLKVLTLRLPYVQLPSGPHNFLGGDWSDVMWMQKDKEELKKLLKEADEDEQALQLVKEDAEQADNEATLARHVHVQAGLLTYGDEIGSFWT